MVHKTLINAWALFFGLSMLMLGNGLQGTLLGVRATLEDFSTLSTGIIMSLYYLGFFIGSIYAPKFVSNVGHIRVFAAFASLASTTILLNGVFTDPWIWGFARFISGFSFAALFIVIESWLNNLASNQVRGKVIAVYVFVTYLAMMLGQYFLNLATPESITLFVLTSILVSVALLPVSLVKTPAPEFSEPDRLSLRRLYIMSPIGIVGAFMSGLAASIMFSIGPVYASEEGMQFSQTANFMAAFIFGGAIFQLPIGWLSDQYDRRKIIVGLVLAAALTTLACYYVGFENPLLLYLCIMIYGGLSLSLYSQCLAHTGDHLNERQIVTAISSLTLVNALGACFGPFIISGIMDIVDRSVFFPFLGLVFTMMFLFSIWRMSVRESVPVDEQSDFTAIPIRSSPMIAQVNEDDVEEELSLDENTEKS